MRGNKKTDTKPEVAVRRILHRLGYRYRLHAEGLPGKPDIVFGSRRSVIFVHGCFWHQHPSDACPLRSRPQTNISYWDAKLDRNVERDAENQDRLNALGWREMTIWECEARNTKSLEVKLRAFLGPTKFCQNGW